MDSPKISVLLPNLNHWRFLEERLQSIVHQTLTDWELVVVDGYSDDGAWELIQAFAEQDGRIRVSQAPREGIYAGLNRCIEQARGEYLYIATSDDTMSPDCLQTMFDALYAHPECEIGHTCLKIINAEGDAASPEWQSFRTAQFYGDWLDRPHIRLAPYDGILHCAVFNVYTSLTQLLIRRSVFEKIGLFRQDWGSVSDFEWGMRAGLACNVLHMPETLATWRVHPQQASTAFVLSSSAAQARFCEMIKAALPTLQRYHPEVYRRIRLHRLLFPYRREQFKIALWELREHRAKYWGDVLKFLLLSPRSVKDFFAHRFFGMTPSPDDFTYLRAELRRLKLDAHLKILDE